MSKNGDQKLIIYEVTLRATGRRSYQAATTARDACKQAGWIITDCFIRPQMPKSHVNKKGEEELLVKIPCLTCPFQYGECRKPITEECPTRPETPDIQEWTKQVLLAHRCDYIGQELAKTDYNLSQKWCPLEQAITELTPKP